MRCDLSEAGRLKSSGSPKRADNEGPLNTILSRKLILRMHFGISGERTRSRAHSASIIGKPARPPTQALRKVRERARSLYSRSFSVA
jgi:hypothetical protein